MAKYISRESAVDAGHLSDWYISSVGDEPPVWTDAHIDELLNDFIVIPKDTKSADVQPVRHGRWEYIRNVKLSGTIKLCECNQCHNKIFGCLSYCGNCGARMIKEGDTNERS